MGGVHDAGARPDKSFDISRAKIERARDLSTDLIQRSYPDFPLQSAQPPAPARISNTDAVRHAHTPLPRAPERML
eukprot:2071291-Prymnesium_polylepis.2